MEPSERWRPSPAIHSSCMSIRMAPTSRMTAAEFGKVPATRERRLISDHTRLGRWIPCVPGDPQGSRMGNLTREQPCQHGYACSGVPEDPPDGDSHRGALYGTASGALHGRAGVRVAAPDR